MTLRRRWTISILAILGLFGLNLGVYFWGNAQRTGIILDLKVALERKDLAVEIRNAIEDGQSDVEVMEPLITSGAISLNDRELAAAGNRMAAIARQIDRLHALSGSVETVRLSLDFGRLQESWLEVYRSSPQPAEVEAVAEEVEAPVGSESGAEPDGEPIARPRTPSSYQILHQEVSVLLEKLERSEAERAQEAERDFSAVAKLTDRITLAIFALSALAAVGIAVWFSRFLRGTFERYLTAEIVTSVLDTPAGLSLGGEKREITVLMADLRGFSSLAERIPAEQVVAVINNFLGTMTEVIVEAGGTIDEFIGDAILVFFGAPLEREDHAKAAVVCALEMQLAMALVNEKNRADGLPEVEMGIGVHSGEAVVGNIGSEKRTKYGAVGSSVNLAGRIEANTVGGQILVSGATRDRIKADLRVDARLEIRPKGLDESVVLFDIGGIGGRGDLELARADEAIPDLPEPIHVRFSILEGKETGSERFDGLLVKLSLKAATIRSRVGLEPLTNIKLDFEGRSNGQAGCAAYAKVVAVDGTVPDTFLVRFTSLTPAASNEIERILAPSSRDTH